MKRSEGGFSLVELLVVIGIVGILSEGAIATYHQFKEKAYRTELITLGEHITTAAFADQANSFENSSNTIHRNVWYRNKQEYVVDERNVAGLPPLPPHIGVYFGILQSGWISLRLCSLRVPTGGGNVAVYRYRRQTRTNLTTNDGMSTPISEAACRAYGANV